MTITREADYALRIVFALSEENAKIDANSLSEKIGVTLRFTLKILRKLLLAGIVLFLQGRERRLYAREIPRRNQYVRCDYCDRRGYGGQPLHRRRI